MKIKRTIIYVEFVDGRVHQVIASPGVKMTALETIRICNNGLLPLEETPTDIKFY